MPLLSSKDTCDALAEVHSWMLERDEEPPHVQHVAKLALELFDQLASLHHFGAEERFMLQAAALLHDIGWSEAEQGRKHHKIAARMICKHNWKRIPKIWVLPIACIARYHRRALPKPRHRGYRRLSARIQQRVGKLAAMLRLADGLDRTHLRRVQHIQVSVNPQTVRLQLEGGRDLRAEIEAATRKSDLFHVAFHKALEITPVRPL